MKNHPRIPEFLHPNLQFREIAGRHTIQFQAKPSDDGMTAKLQLGYGKDEQIQNAVLQFKLGEQQQAPKIVNVLDVQKTVRLVERSLEGSEKTLTLAVNLHQSTDVGN